MRARTSPTAISTSCCWPRSIARCSGSARSHGGSSSGWPSLPKSSATTGRSRRSTTGCPTRRCCSIWCTARSESLPGSRWREPARCATRLELILAAATLPPKLGWRKRLWIVAAIVPFVIVSAGSIAYRTLPASAHAVDGASEMRRPLAPPQHVDFYAIGPGSVFAISRDGDDRYGQLTGQRRLRLAALQDGTYSYSSAAGQITFAIRRSTTGRTEAAPERPRRARDPRSPTLPGESAAPDKAPIDQYVGWYALAAEPRAHGHARR